MGMQSAISRFAAFLLVMPVFLGVPEASAARFILPDDAVVSIKELSFPASTGNNDRDALCEAFHLQLTLALEQSGLAVFHGENASAPLAATPLEAPAETDAPPGGDGEDAPDDSAEDMVEETLPVQEPRPWQATHILEGTVTLFRENVGRPTRIGESIRIRAESQIHCAYKIRDAVTGNVLLSDVSSGSAARIASETEDIDATLRVLSARAMAATAATVAANLSGNSVPGTATPSSRDYYRDSPGKRLKGK
jgi:hypothetical protein